MAFDVRVTSSDTPRDNSAMIAMNEYVVETAGVSKKKDVYVGYISMIVDLGKQIQEDGMMDSDIPLEEEADYIEKNPGAYFEDHKDHTTKKVKRVKRFPVKPQQCVAVAVDFPDILLDKGQFFGDESKTKLPLRLWLGGTFYRRGEKLMTVGRPIALQNRKNDDGNWSFSKNHQFYKLAEGADLLDKNGCFTSNRIDELLGKSYRWDIQIYFKQGDNNEKYYTEYIKYSGALGSRDVAPDVLTTPLLVQFNTDNDEQAIKELRNHVVNTMRLSSEYAGSKVAEQLERLRGVKPLGSVPQANEPAAPKQTSKVSGAATKATAPAKENGKVDNNLPAAFQVDGDAPTDDIAW